MATHSWTRIEDVYARVLVGDANNLGHIHAADAADLSQLVRESNIDRTECVFHNLGHLCSANIGDANLTLAEARVNLSDLFSNFGIVRTNGAVVVQQLIDHIARDDALGRVYELDICATSLFKQWAHEAIDGVGRHS